MQSHSLLCIAILPSAVRSRSITTIELPRSQEKHVSDTLNVSKQIRLIQDDWFMTYLNQCVFKVLLFDEGFFSTIAVDLIFFSFCCATLVNTPSICCWIVIFMILPLFFPLFLDVEAAKGSVLEDA